ncbi:MAG: carbohydrate ABC transporter permease [Hyphomicrobiales bacterium]
MMSLPSRHRRLSLTRLAIYFALAIWSLLCIIPLYWLTLASLKSVTDLDGRPRFLPLIDFIPDLYAWRFILLDPVESLIPRFFNSLVISAGPAIITVMMAVLSFYGMTRYRSSHFFTDRYRSVIFLVVIALRLVSPALVALPAYLLATQLHIIDTHSLLIGLYSAFNYPLALLLVSPVLRWRPTVEEESARLEGASHLRIITDILLPMNRAHLTTIGLFLFLLSWNEYLFASYLTYHDAETLTPWVVSQLSLKEAQTGGGSEDIAHVAAAAIFMAMPAILLAVSLQRLVKTLIGRSLE